MTNEYIENHFKKLIKNKDKLTNDEKFIRETLDKHIESIPNKKLYKFRTCSRINLKTLEANKIYMSAASDFKDDFDRNLNFDFQNDFGNFKGWTLSNIHLLIYLAIKKELTKKHIRHHITPEIIKNICDTYCLKECEISDEELNQDKFNLFYKDRVLINKIKSGINLIFKKNNNEIDEFCKKLVKKVIDINKLPRTNSLVYCLTEDYDNHAMWENYSDNYTGFCIEYDFSNFNDFSLGLIKNLLYLMPMIYVKEKPNLSLVPFADYAVRSAIGEKLDLDEFLLNINKQMLYKKEDYAFEHEWRISILNQNNNLQHFPFISSLYVGKNISNKNLIMIKKIADKLKIPVFQQQVNLFGGKYEYSII